MQLLETIMLDRSIKLKKRLADGETVFGAWHTIPDICTVEAIADAGFDFVIIDAEHSPWTIEALQSALVAFRGVETVPMARIPWNDPVYIKQALDVGLEGIMAPMVRTVDEAKALVSACHYPPQGTRGFGPRRGSRYFRQLSEYVANAANGIFVMPQIEDYRTVDDIDAIMDVPGIDAISVGPTDMSGTLGLLGQVTHETVNGYIDQILAKAQVRNMPVMNGLTIETKDQARWISKGARMVLVSQDISSLMNETGRLLAAARQAHGASHEHHHVSY